jgi:hypothetical protein
MSHEVNFGPSPKPAIEEAKPRQAKDFAVQALIDNLVDRNVKRWRSRDGNALDRSRYARSPPERMLRGVNTGAPSPSCTLPWLWVAASRTTFSPITGRRAFRISRMECLPLSKFLFPIPRHLNWEQTQLLPVLRPLASSLETSGL